MMQPFTIPLAAFHSRQQQEKKNEKEKEKPGLTGLGGEVDTKGSNHVIGRILV